MIIRTGRVFFSCAAVALCSAVSLAAQARSVHEPRGQALRSTASKPTTRGHSTSSGSICEIPAPPFKEATRGAEYKRRLEALGLTVRTDSIGNVIAERRGTGGGKTVLIEGHLDTVFPEGTNVKVKREGHER
jgi:hypothetical protein